MLAAAVAVLASGGAGVEALIAVAGLVGVAWLFGVPSVPHKPPHIAFAWLWLGLGAWSTLQVVPLPRGLTALLHPRAVTLSDASRAALDLPVLDWLPMALAPGDAALQAALYLVVGAAGALASLVLMGTTGRNVVEWLVIAMVAVGLASGMAWLGGNYLDILEILPGRLPSELRRFAFVNPNHQAGFLNFCLALTLGLATAAPTLRLQLVYGLTGIFFGLTILLIGSRGGFLVLGIVLVLTYVSQPLPARLLRADPQDTWRAAQARLLAFLICVALLGALLALPVLEKEFLNSNIATDSKLRIFAKLPAFLKDTWLVGIGPGSLPVLAGMDPAHGGARIDFVENIVGQRLVDAGVPLAIGFFAYLGWRLREMVRRSEGLRLPRQMVIAMAAIVLANLVDFSLELAGCLLPLMLIAAGTERLLPPPGNSVKRNDEDRYKYTLQRRILASSGIALAAVAGLLQFAWGGLTRDASAALQGQEPAAARALLAKRFSYDHHGFYLYGRGLLAAGDQKGAVRAFDRAVVLRPDSKHARLFRFATQLELGDPRSAAADLPWLLRADAETFTRVLTMCLRSPEAEKVLEAALPQVADLSLQIGAFFEYQRPDLAERLAVSMRARMPNKRFGIEHVRGRIYLRRGHLEQARRIAAELLADKSTQQDGYMLEGLIRWHTARQYDAHHLFRVICDEHPTSSDACDAAVRTLLESKRPLQALEYIRTRWPFMRDYPSRAALYWQFTAQAQLDLGRNEDAVESARTAHGLWREDLAPSLLLGEALIRIGHYLEARDVLEPNRAAHPNHAHIKLLWGQVQAALAPLHLRATAQPDGESGPGDPTPAGEVIPAAPPGAAPAVDRANPRG